MDEKLSNPFLSMNKNSLFDILFGWCMQQKKGWKVALGERQVEDELKVQLSYECLGYGWIILYKVQGAIKSFLFFKKLIVGKHCEWVA